MPTFLRFHRESVEVAATAAAAISGGTTVPVAIGVAVGLKALDLISRLFSRSNDEPEPESFSLTTLTASSTSAQWVFGERLIAGVMVFYEEVTNKPFSDVHMTIVLSEGACEEITGISVDGQFSLLSPSTTFAGALTLSVSIDEIDTPNGWSTIPPAGTDTLWVRYATAASRESKDTISPSEWSSAVEEGANINVRTIYLYRRATSVISPPTPTDTGVYTFATDTITFPSGGDNGWGQTISGPGRYVHVCHAVAANSATTDTILATEWSDPEIVQNVADPLSERSSVLVSIYKRAANQPPTSDRPGGKATYSLLYNERVLVWPHMEADGTEGAELESETAQWNTARHKLNGLSWVHVKLRQRTDGDRFWTRLPQLKFLLKGIKISAPRDRPTFTRDQAFTGWSNIEAEIAVTSTGAMLTFGQRVTLTNANVWEETRLYDGTTWVLPDAEDDIAEWTDSAAAIRYWLMRNRRGIPKDRIDVESVREAERICTQNVTVTYPTADYADYPTTSRRYTINGVIASDENMRDIEDQMDWAWQGSVIDVNGKHVFRPGAERTPVSSAIDTTEDVVEMVSIQPAPAMEDRVNALNVTLRQSSVHRWTKLSLLPYVDTAAETRDGRRLTKSINARFVSDPIAGGRLQAIALRRARASAIYRYRLRPGNSLEWSRLVPTDRVMMTDLENGLSNQRMLVIRTEVHEDWSVSVDLSTDPDGVYDDTLVLPPVIDNDMDVPDPRDVPIPASVSVTVSVTVSKDGTVTGGFVLTWNEEVVASTDVRWRKVGDPEWSYVSSTSTGARISDIVPGTYEYQLRHVASNLITSDWTVVAEIEIEGDSTPPPAPENLTAAALPGGYEVRWRLPTERDYVRAEIRDLPQGEDIANLVFRATLSSTSYTRLGISPQDPLTVIVTHFDRSGNASTSESTNVTPLAPVAGADGEDGVGAEYVFTRTATATLATSKYPNNSWGYDSPDIIDGQLWYDSAPSVNATSPYLWRSERAVEGVPATGAAVTDTWSIPVVVGRFGGDGADGEDGSGIEYVFTKTSTSTFSSTTKYPSNLWGYDSPGTSDGQLWEDGAPDLDATSSYLWRSERAVEGVPATGAAVTDTWSTPVIVGRYGIDGLSTAQVTIYKQSAARPDNLTDRPTGNSTYTFSTGSLIIGTPNGWSETPPEISIGFIWARYASVSSDSDTDNIAATKWSSPLQHNVIRQSALVVIFKRPATQPSSTDIPANDFIYTFSTRSLAITAGGNAHGWASKPPSGTETIWARYATASAAADQDFIPASEWSAAIQYASG